MKISSFSGLVLLSGVTPLPLLVSAGFHTWQLYTHDRIISQYQACPSSQYNCGCFEETSSGVSGSVLIPSGESQLDSYFNVRQITWCGKTNMPGMDF
jgi:hypothetical protein